MVVCQGAKCKKNNFFYAWQNFSGGLPPAESVNKKNSPKGVITSVFKMGSQTQLPRSEFSSDSIRIVLTEILFTLLVAGFAQHACLD